MIAVNSEINAAYRKGLAPGYYEEDEPGGKCQAYPQAPVDLHVLLGRQPWETFLFDTVDSDQPPAWMIHNFHRASWLPARYMF
jgi:hypothetical protein